MPQTIIIAVLFLIAAVCLTVIGCDVVPMLLTWVSRIHIGRFTSREEWQSKAQSVALKQIKKLPAMPVTDKTAYTVIPKLKGEYNNKKFRAWQEASLLLSLSDNEEAKKSAYDFFLNAKPEEQEYTPGNAMLLYALLSSGFENDAKVKAAADDYCKKALAAAGEGTLPYNPGVVNRYVDVLGMVCPFLVKYHLTYGCPDALELAKKQLEEYYRFGVHPSTGLPVHCFNVLSKAPLGVYGWGRGCGWLAIALAECYAMLNGKDDYADTLLARIDAFAKSVKKYQNKNGSFSSMLGTSGRADSSATAILAWFLARAGKALDNDEYSARAGAAEKYLISVTRRNGKVDFAQGDTMGPGNYSRRFEPLPAAQGFALRIGK